MRCPTPQNHAPFRGAEYGNYAQISLYRGYIGIIDDTLRGSLFTIKFDEYIGFILFHVQLFRITFFTGTAIYWTIQPRALNYSKNVPFSFIMQFLNMFTFYFTE